MFAKAFLVAGVIASATVGANAHRSTSNSVTTGVSLRDIPELAWHTQTGDECTVQCWDQHDADVHIAKEVDPEEGLNEVGNGPHDSPYAGLCDEKHPSCGMNLANASIVHDVMAGIHEAIVDHDGRRLRDLLERHDHVAYFAPERGAVQVRGCKGELVAHIPVSTDLVASLE